MSIAFLLVAAIASNTVFAQRNLPTDYLSPDFHAGRREAFRQAMPANSVAVIFAYPEQVFSRDVNYAYHANPDLYYLTGYKEPDAMLLLFKDNQRRGDSSFNEVFFVRKRNPVLEAWTGRRLGTEGTKKQLGIRMVFDADKFKTFDIDLQKFSKILYDDLPQIPGYTQLSTLVNTFRQRAGIKEPANKNLDGYLTVISRYTTPTNLTSVIAHIKARIAEAGDESIAQNPLLVELFAHPDSATLVSVQRRISSEPSPTEVYNNLLGSLREIKTPEEMALMRKSIGISAMAHNEVMKAIDPATSEMALSGLFQHVHKQYGAEDEGYPPIVGAGDNGCILHYIENNATRVDNQLVLMDVGSEYHGYSADITRTVPANGKFTPEQRAIYQLVYDAQDAVFALCREGTPFTKLNETATEVLAQGLIKLGIIKQAREVSKYYLHGCSHHLGLDVHDKNISPLLKENMVITVEPGIYIPKGSDCDPKWWNLAVRIEDDVRIGKTTFENLSIAAPRSIDAVEKMMAQKSIFSEWALPPVK